MKAHDCYNCNWPLDATGSYLWHRGHGARGHQIVPEDRMSSSVVIHTEPHRKWWVKVKMLNRINLKTKVIAKTFHRATFKTDIFLIKLTGSIQQKGERDFNISLCLFLLVHRGHRRWDGRFLRDVWNRRTFAWWQLQKAVVCGCMRINAMFAYLFQDQESTPLGLITLMRKVAFSVQLNPRVHINIPW